MKKRLVMTLMATSLLLTAGAGWQALATVGTAPAAPRAKASVAATDATSTSTGQQAQRTQPPGPTGFCIDIDRDSRWTCFFRSNPADPAAGKCKTIVSLLGVVTYTNCENGP